MKRLAIAAAKAIYLGKEVLGRNAINATPSRRGSIRRKGNIFTTTSS